MPKPTGYRVMEITEDIWNGERRRSFEAEVPEDMPTPTLGSYAVPRPHTKERDAVIAAARRVVSGGGPVASALAELEASVFALDLRESF